MTDSRGSYLHYQALVRFQAQELDGFQIWVGMRFGVVAFTPRHNDFEEVGDIQCGYDLLRVQSRRVCHCCSTKPSFLHVLDKLEKAGDGLEVLGCQPGHHLRSLFRRRLLTVYCVLAINRFTSSHLAQDEASYEFAQ